jgi:hypothetical protein
MLHGLRSTEQRSKDRATALFRILTSLAGGEGQGEHVLYCNGSFKGIEATTAFSRDAQLQITVKCRCWYKAFVLYMMSWKSPIAGHAKTLCCGEQQNAIAR